jgi:hypothetical protein
MSEWESGDIEQGRGRGRGNYGTQMRMLITQLKYDAACAGGAK